MARLVAGAWYVPGYVDSGRVVAGPDEDAFTLVATAIERLPAVPRGEPGATRVHLVGDFPPVVDWGVAALLGRPIEVARHGAGVAGLREAMSQIELPTQETPQLVAVAELPERGAPPVPGTPGGGAGAAVLWFSPGAPLSTSDRELLFRGPDALSGAIALLLGSGPGVAAPAPVPRPPRPLVMESIRPFVEALPTAVSEGAYVPRARYLENLPSRWRLVGERCAHCHSLTFPARGVCRGCGHRDALVPEAQPLDGGTVVAATTIGKGGQPTEFDLQVGALGDYGVVLVELSPGVRLTLQVTDANPGDLPIGARVSTRLRRLYPMEGEWRYGRKAIPLQTAGPVS